MEAEQDGRERLQKILAHAGVGSRRACEELILQGRVTVGGQVVRELGTKVDPVATPVALDGQKLHSERPVYFAVFKPKGYVSTNADPSGRPRVVDLLPQIPQRVYTVGRLDEMSVGLMLLTNDGELANKLSHPKFGVEKLYRVVVAGTPTREVLDQLTEGVWIAEGKVRAKKVRVVAKKGLATVLEMVLAEGKNREVRRMLARLGHKVMNLTRVAVGPITVKGLTSGQYRPLTGREVDLLRRVAAGEPVPMPWMGTSRPPRRDEPSENRPRPDHGPMGANRPPQGDDRRERRFDNGPGAGPGRFERGPGMDRPPFGDRRGAGPGPGSGPMRGDGPRRFNSGLGGSRPPARTGPPAGPGRDQGPGPGRFDGPPPRRFEGRQDGPRRFDQGGPPRGDGGPRRFDQGGPPRGDGGPRRFEQGGPPRHDGPRRFEQGGPPRHDGPRQFNQDGPRRFEQGGPPPRQDGPRRFDQGGPPRPDGPRRSDQGGPPRPPGRPFQGRNDGPPRRPEGENRFNGPRPQRDYQGGGRPPGPGAGPRRHDGPGPIPNRRTGPPPPPWQSGPPPRRVIGLDTGPAPAPDQGRGDRPPARMKRPTERRPMPRGGRGPKPLPRRRREGSDGAGDE